MTHAELDAVRRIGAADHWLAVVVTHHASSREVDAAVVNAAPIDHPITGREMVAFVGRPGAKLRNLRTHPTATLVFRSGWHWAAIQGAAELIGPDNPHPDLDEDKVTELLRTIFHAAGGTHPDLNTYDRVMRAERRTAVLVTPQRVWTNPTSAEHREPETHP